MMNKLIPNILLTIFVLANSTLFAQNFPEPMNPPRLVNDFAGVLSNQEFQTLENKLERYADTTSNQVAIVIINTTGDYDIAQYGAELGEKWGVGGNKNNNGILIVVAVQDRNVNISTGYGLEGAVPDIAARRIIQDYMVPNFRENNYYGGLDQATTVIIKLAEGEYKAEDVAQGRQANRRSSRGRSRGIGIFLPLLFFAMFSFFRYRGVARRQLGHNAGFWAIMALMMTSGGRRGSGWNDFQGGGGSFGGGGGFGGFGGGGFGGGGASGSW